MENELYLIQILTHSLSSWRNRASNYSNDLETSQTAQREPCTKLSYATFRLIPNHLKLASRFTSC